MKRPNILFMNRIYPPTRGATGRVLRDLAVKMAREGWHVTIIASGPVAGQGREKNVRIIRVKGPEKPSNAFVYMWVWIKMLALALRLKRRHLIVTMTDPPLLIYVGRIVAWIKKSHHVHWCQDLYPDLFPVIGTKMPSFLMKFMKTLNLESMRSCDKIVVNGQCMGENLVHQGVGLEKLEFIPNWADTELNNPDFQQRDMKKIAEHYPVSEDAARPHAEQIKHKSDKFRLLYAGNIGRAHSVNIILDAAEILSDKKVDAEIVFVGDGSRFDYVQEQRAKRHLHNIKLLPYQPPERLREIMESGDVHLVSMKDEACGLLVPSKFYSAIAVARPVIFIGPENSEVSEAIKEFEAGLLVSNDSAELLAEAILFYLSDGEAWFTAHKGAAEARKTYNPENSIDTWLNFAIKLIAEDLKVK
ncbi:MAG: glycosyltransferase family 4 protein [Alphaproteobacteria bacterium]|nr:glycosyltransferase family 4 protein [Alphaproteobacteria bacterium]